MKSGKAPPARLCRGGGMPRCAEFHTQKPAKRKAFSLGRRCHAFWRDGCGVHQLSKRSDKPHRVPSTPGPFGATLCKQERAFLKAGKCLLLIKHTPPVVACATTAPSYEGAKGMVRH